MGNKKATGLGVGLEWSNESFTYLIRECASLSPVLGKALEVLRGMRQLCHRSLLAARLFLPELEKDHPILQDVEAVLEDE